MQCYVPTGTFNAKEKDDLNESVGFDILFGHLMEKHSPGGLNGNGEKFTSLSNFHRLSLETHYLSIVSAKSSEEFALTSKLQLIRTIRLRLTVGLRVFFWMCWNISLTSLTNCRVSNTGYLE